MSDFLGCWIESENSLEESSISMFGIDAEDIKERFFFLNAGDKPGEEVLSYRTLYSASFLSFNRFGLLSLMVVFCTGKES